MTDYTLIDSGKALCALVDLWQRDNVTEIAVDFEGEFNLHCYGEHLCLIQIFDKRSFYIVDPFLIDDDSLRLFLESKWLKKLWFDCTSDGSLVWKLYHIKIMGVYDLYPLSKVLGVEGNLSSLVAQFCEGNGAKCVEKVDKKKNQKTNWMNRPLSSEQLTYALSDVANLFTLRDAFLVLAEELNKTKQVQNVLKMMPRIKTKETPGYEKLPGYARMSKVEQAYARYFFAARDMVARECNKPAFMVMDKYDVVKMARHVPLNEFHFKAQAKCRNAAMEQRLIPLLMQAKADADASLHR